MDNKIFDILPPQKKELEILPQKKPPQTASPAEAKKADAPMQKIIKKEREITQDISVRKKPGFRFRKILILLVFLLVVFVLASNFIFNRAHIKIWPKVDASSWNGDITVSTANAPFNVQEKIIPGKIFEDEKIVSQEFSATGKTMEGQKAAGKIRVYNNYSTSPQVLIKNTRFISAEGKLFRTTEKVIVPGGSYEKGKLQPGYVDVSVSADQAGQEYNIGPSTFSIPGFAGTAKYTAFYGKSSEPMSGGVLGEVSQILKDDLDAAKETLTAKAAEEGKASLKNKISSDFVLLDQALYQEVLAATSSSAAGTIAKTFTYQLKLKLKGMAFSSSDLNNLSKEILLLNFGSGKKIQEGTLNIGYDFYSLDLDSGKMILRARLSSKIYSDINEDNFSQSLAGKSLEQARQIITAQPEITKAQIVSWPLWANSIPKDQKKIKIKLVLD